eukprot:TRINITY_DN2014_c0_g1_i1.p1 TRINITY_DN2014_c0_g1~~TRINITY_DN2014_c0_g1_i1.p1  ORF type:complete len:364 (-),score=39.93 TRINITY_DN2014_c0_g1_i1:164-1255(-)
MLRVLALIVCSLLLIQAETLCLNTHYQTFKPSTENVNCLTTSSLTASVIGGPATCTAGGVHTAQLRLSYAAKSHYQYDFAYFVDLIGGDARTGENCYSNFLPAAAHQQAPYDLLSGSGPFRNSDGDDCGDIVPDSGVTYFHTVSITFPCEDSNDDGLADINSCVSWKLGGPGPNIPCSGYSKAFASSKNQCECVTLDITDLQVQPVSQGNPPPACTYGELIPITESDVYFTLEPSTAISNFLSGHADVACEGASFSFGEWTHLRAFYVDLNTFNDEGSMYLTSTCGWTSETRMLAWEVAADENPTCIPEELLYSQCSVPFEPCLNNSWLVDLSTSGTGKYIIWLFSKSDTLGIDDEMGLTKIW